MKYVLFHVRNNVLSTADDTIYNELNTEVWEQTVENLQYLSPALFSDWDWIAYYPRERSPILTTLQQRL